MGQDIQNEPDNSGQAMLKRLILWIEKEAANAGPATLNKLVLWVEKEAHLAGSDIEVDTTNIISKLQRKQKR